MDNRTKAVTVMLHNISYVKARELLQSCELPEDEYDIVLNHVVYKKSLSYLADEKNISYSTAKRILKRALLKIWLTLNQ